MAHALALRPATGDDLDLLGTLARDPLVEPYLAPEAWERSSLSAWLERDPEGCAPPSGPYVIESNAGTPLGGLVLVVVNRRHGICDLARVMVMPEGRRAGAALAAIRLAAGTALVEHGLHRLEAQVYGDNLAGQRLFERAGFAREVSGRRAYWRREQWLDGIHYGLLAEEFDGSTGTPP